MSTQSNDNTGLQLFNYKGKDVRAIWFEEKQDWVYPLIDVCGCAGIINVSNVVKRLRPKGVHTMDLLSDGGVQATTCISLSNVFLVLLQSRKEEAEPFQDWVCEEVLPSIFKTGSYSVNDDLLADLKKWQLSTKVIEAITKAVQSKSVLDDKERVGYAAVLLQNLRRQIYHDTRSYEGTIEVLYGKGAIPNIKGDIAKITAEIKNGQVIVQLQFPFDNAVESVQ